MDCDINLNFLTASQKHWLNDVKRLSQSLNASFPNWNMTLCYSGLITPTVEEAHSLASSLDKQFYGRLITHNIGSDVVIIGKVLMTHSTYIAYKDKLDHLNNQSIGDSLLFVEPMSRIDFSVNKVNKCTLNFMDQATEKKLFHLIPDQVFTRNALFVSDLNQDYRMLVKEYFLKDIMAYEK